MSRYSSLLSFACIAAVAVSAFAAAPGGAPAPAAPGAPAAGGRGGEGRGGAAGTPITVVLPPNVRASNSPIPASAADKPLGVLAPAGSPTKQWTADNGNGTYTNPLFYEEFEDPDVIRVGDTYYLAGTTMHMQPAVQLMVSKDLVNWELAGYCAENLDLGPTYRLEGGNQYGRGIWAPCIRYNKGTFYVFTNVNGAGLQVFQSKSIYGPWQHHQIPGRHDMSVLFDDDLGKIFIISGGSSPYPIEELTPDLKGYVPGVRYELRVPQGQRMGEGHHLYKINGKYVDVSAIPGGNTDQMVATADNINGPWRSDLMVSGENFGVPSQPPRRPGVNIPPNDKNYTLHQGGIVDTPNGEWWAIIMADRGSAGRMVNLVPVTWDNGLPYVGLPGNLRKAPNTWVKPNTGVTQEPKPSFVKDDNFNNTYLNPHWQWNHVADKSKWSLTENPGKLRLHSLPASDFYNARNSLSTRPPAPESTYTVELDTGGLKTGDNAGLALLNNPYVWIGVVKTSDGMAVQTLDATGAMPGRGGGRGRGRGADPGAAPAAPPQPTITKSADPVPAKVWLRVNTNFDTDYATFSWSTDGKTFNTLGNPHSMRYNYQGTFQGVRPSLFNFNTGGQPGGYADFDNFTVEEPRARTSERDVPVGKTIVLTAGPSNNLIAAQDDKLVTIAAADSAPANAKFQIVDLGKGRVALKNGGKTVSVTADGVILKDLGNAQPGVAESFQWVHLMRDDHMLMSLTNHKYLGSTPGTPGPVTVTTAGPRPDRKSGAEFRYTVAN